MKTITASVLKKRIKGKKILDVELFASNDDHFIDRRKCDEPFSLRRQDAKNIYIIGKNRLRIKKNRNPASSLGRPSFD